jgi:anti-sigma-K factor RskA
LDLEDYIESGIIESYLLGLATRDEVVMFERMRNIYPQLNGEIATMEYKLQRLGEEGGIAPPAQVWNRIAERIQWEGTAIKTGSKQTQNQGHTYIIQAQNRTMTISIWWRCAFIALCVIVMALMASTFYFYQKYSQLERHLLQLSPISQPMSQPVVK